MIEGHGDDIYRYGDKIRYNFSSNIYQMADHSGLMKALYGGGDIFSTYPEPAPFSLEAALSEEHSVPSNCVVATNGATEAIYLAAFMLSGKRSAIFFPTFSEYEDACKIYGHTIARFSCINDIPEADAVWICNPNNPDGKAYSRDTLLEVVDRHPATLFVVDLAYHNYSATKPLLAADAVVRKNLILLYSMTKDFSVPGLRIGYAVSSEQIATRLRGLKMPWSVNSVALKAAAYLLKNKDLYKIPLQELLSEAARVKEALKSLGIEVSDSDANFMLCRLPNGSAADLKSFLIESDGILIRDASNFAGLTPSHFRIAVQSREMNDILIQNITKWSSFCR